MTECAKDVNNVTGYIFKKNKYTESYHVLLLEDKNGKFYSPAGEVKDKDLKGQHECFNVLERVFKEDFGSDIPKILKLEEYDMLKTRIYYGEIDKIGKFEMKGKAKSYQMISIDQLIENEFNDKEVELRDHVKRSLEHLYEEGKLDEYVKYPLKLNKDGKNKKDKPSRLEKVIEKYFNKENIKKNQNNNYDIQYSYDPVTGMLVSNVGHNINFPLYPNLSYGTKQYAVYLVPTINDQVVIDHERRTGLHITLADFHISNNNFDHFIQQVNYHNSNTKWSISPMSFTNTSNGIEFVSTTLSRVTQIMKIAGLRGIRSHRWRLKIDESDPSRFNYILNRLLQSHWQYALVEFIGNGQVMQYRKGYCYRLV